MNQQSGMEADKEIDRFLQKVKKRDMRQKSILLLGMYALVGSILGFLVQCVAIWYPFYNCVPTSAAVFLGSIAVGGVHLFLCRTTTRRAARLADNMGMQERVSTSIEGRGSTDELRILQRIDTRDQLRNISLEKTMPYYIPWKRYVSLGVFLLMGFICLFIPSEAKDVAKQKHEFVKKVEKEQEKIAKAKKVLDKEMAKGKISKESRKKLEESIKTAQKDMKQARSVDEVTAAQKRLETKLLRDVPENISKEAADSLRPFVDGKNLQALSKYQKQLADLAGKQKAVAAVSDELKELGEQLSESKMKELMQQLNEKAQSGALTQQDISEVLRNLDNASASYTRSALLQDQTDSNAATQNQNTQALRLRMLHRMPRDNRETVPKNCPVMVLKVLKMMVKVDQAVRQVPVKMPAVGMVAAKVKTVTKLEVDGTPVVKTDWNEKVRRTAQNKSGFRRIMGKMAI